MPDTAKIEIEIRCAECREPLTVCDAETNGNNHVIYVDTSDCTCLKESDSN